MKAFEGRTFPSLESAMRAIDLWPGRDMLELRDVERCAAHLVDLTQIAGPPADIPPARRGLLRMLGVAR
jgi:hypothetical protein